MMPQYRSIFWVTLFLQCLPGIAFAQTSDEPTQRVTSLIEQLGDKNFTVRERAQSDLARMGIAAFDQLFGAMRDSDLEVARRAQYLIRSVEIKWAQPEYTDEVNAFLSRYGKLNVEKRRSRITELARLKTDESLSALCRIARYDVSEILSKEAALAAAIHFQKVEKDRFPKLQEIIEEKVAGGPRRGPAWLRLFGKFLENGPAPISDWEQQIQDEIELYTTRPELTSQSIVLDLVRFEVDQLRSADRGEDAIVAMQRIIPISAKFSENEITDLTTWFLDRNGFPVVKELAKFHEKLAETPEVEDAPIGGIFGETQNLLYLLAEAMLRQNNVEEATKYADAARNLVPDELDSHYFAANTLQERGAFRWARAEFEYVLSKLDIDNTLSGKVRRTYAEMEFDQGNPEQATKIIWPWVELVEKEFNAREPFDPESDEQKGSRLARAYLFRSQWHLQQNKEDEAKEDLAQALKYYKDEADVLIAAYKIKGDPKWEAIAQSHIEKTLSFYKPYIEKFQKQYKFFKENSRGGEGAMGGQMAIYCNQYSWLVGNTFGDIDHAIESSLLSLEIEPSYGAYLDTLAHCYVSKKEYKKAIEAQSLSVKMLPFSGQIRSKYSQFAKLCDENGIEYDPIEIPKSPDTHFPDYQREGSP